MNVANATPQAAVTSSSLWVVVINQILIYLTKSGIKIVPYIDDLVLG